jgi:DDE superfamily endonuclease
VIGKKPPLLEGFWCTMDGLKTTIQKLATNKIQNQYFNGWQHDNYVLSVFVFVPDGKVAICCFNDPGCVHDSKIANWGDDCTKLETVFKGMVVSALLIALSVKRRTHF